MSHQPSSKFFLKSVHVFFIALLCAGSYFIYERTNMIRIDDSAYARAGSVIKEKFPGKYDMYTDEETGRRLLGKGYVSEEQRFVLKSVGMTDNAIANLLVTLPYSWEEKALDYTMFITVWAAVFALILRIAERLFGSNRQIKK